MKKKNIFGFTVVELIVVVAILGILAAIVIPVYTGQSSSANRNKVKTDLATLDMALQAYFIDNSAWPVVTPGPTALNFLVSGGYLNAVPVPAAVAAGTGKAGYIYTAQINSGYQVTTLVSASGSYPGVSAAAVYVCATSGAAATLLTGTALAADPYNW